MIMAMMMMIMKRGSTYVYEVGVEVAFNAADNYTECSCDQFSLAVIL